MAKVGGVFNDLKGSVGDIVFAKRNNQTYAYQKPQIKDAKTIDQMERRTRWANALHTYRAYGKYFYGAFENKPENVNDYNRFMSLNVSYPIYLTKEEKEAQSCIAAPYQITEGSLPAILVEDIDGATLKTNIRIDDLVIDENTTLEDFSMKVLRNNDAMRNLDKIVFFQSIQLGKQDIGSYRIDPCVTVVQLCCSNVRLLDLAPIGFENVDGYLGAHNLKDGCFAWVHTRKPEPNMPALVSTQHLINMNKELVAEYSSKKALKRAAKSYGAKNLEPIFLKAGKSQQSSVDYPFM